MIGGQVVDIESEGVTPTADLVETIHRAKTGALITTSIVSGALYGSSQRALPDNMLARIREFGEKAGLAFQIVDDILDMTQSSAELGKTAAKTPPASRLHGPPSTESNSPAATPTSSSPMPSPR